MRPRHKPTLWKVAGWIGGALGTTAALATATQSTRIARQRRPVARSDEQLGGLRPDRESTVTADDGVPLSVEEVDPADGGDPELTVVLVHGYTLDRRCWHFQRRDIAGSVAPGARQVLYDQRSHGRSGRSSREACTVDMLGRDLDAVIRAVAPTGPLVLLGHSMGGMTIMALAERNPQLFAERVCGVALLNTSAGEIGRSGLPRPFLSRRNPVMVAAARVAAWQPTAVERGRALGNHLLWGLTRRLAFGGNGASPALVDLVDSMIGATPVEVMTDFLKTLGAHDRYSALAGLRHVETLVLGSDDDRLIPYQHSEAIAALLPDAELVCLPGAGHLAMLAQPDAVTGHVLGMLSRCAGPPGHRRGA
jgi:pimeloyl-ACP methyl ester carboxylesterase